MADVAMTARSASPLFDSGAMSLDQLPMLPVILDKVGSLMTERIRPLAAAMPHFTLNELTSERIGDALDVYEMSAIAGVFHVPAWDNRVIVGFDRDFIYTVVELLFGGDGSEPPWEEVRSFSSIEFQVARHLFGQVALTLQTAFAPVSQARFRFERAETRIDFASAGRRNTQGVVARYVMQAINRGGTMFVILPHAALSPMRQLLSRITVDEAAAADPEWIRQITSEVKRTEVGIRAIMESDAYTLGDLAALKVGDTLKLDSTLRSRVKVESNDQPLYWAYVGENEGLHTLRIDEQIDPEQQFFSDVLAR